MQKKLIALAVAGLVSGAAFAQSNVVIYGVADGGFTYANDSYKDGSKSMFAVHSGGQSGSRFGFKGTEDLGNGLSATFNYEAGINLDNGTSGQDGRLFGRWATVGLKGSFGEVQLGRRDTFQGELLAGVSINARATVAQESPIYVDVDRINNMFAYISPDMAGFQIKAGFSTASANGDVEPTYAATQASANNIANTNERTLMLAANYSNGPLFVGASYARYKAQSRSAAAGVDASYDATSSWDVGATYDFKVVKLHGAYGQINPGDSFTANLDKRKQWMLGVTAPIGSKFKVGASYARAKQGYDVAGVSDDKSAIWGLNAWYQVSKRTNFYAAYGKIKQDDDNVALYNITGTGYQQAFQVGLRHKF